MVLVSFHCGVVASEIPLCNEWLIRFIHIKYSYKAIHLFVGHYDEDNVGNLFSIHFTTFRNSQRRTDSPYRVRIICYPSNVF